jgi:hypothetical protein
VGVEVLGYGVPILAAFAQSVVGSAQLFHDGGHPTMPALGVGLAAVNLLFQQVKNAVNVGAGDLGHPGTLFFPFLPLSEPAAWCCFGFHHTYLNGMVLLIKLEYLCQCSVAWGGAPSVSRQSSVCLSSLLRK